MSILLQKLKHYLQNLSAVQCPILCDILQCFDIVGSTTEGHPVCKTLLNSSDIQRFSFLDHTRK